LDIVVYKLGGSILRGREDISKIVDVAESELGSGRVPVCVVSAMKGVTDRIIQALSQVRVESFDPHAFTGAMMGEHLATLPEGADAEPLRKEFEKLEHVLSYVRSSGELGDSVYAYTVSRGENFVMRLIAAHLEARGVRSRCFYGEDLLVTDENNREAAVNLERTKLRVEEQLAPNIAEGVVPVIAGFAGRSGSGLITIFGRGGTDDTAACLAYCLGVKRLVKFVDEGGIMSLDPKFYAELEKPEIKGRVGAVPKPSLIPYISYVEASELLREERTKVVHFKVLDPLMRGGIKLQLKSIGALGEGTIIGPENGGSGSGHPKAVSFQRNLYGVRVLPTQSVLPTEVYAELFNALSHAGVDVRYISTSGYQISLLVQKQDVELAMRALSGLPTVVEVKPIEGRKGSISVIGSEMRGVKGFFSRLTGALAGQGVNIEQAMQPNSENIIRFSVSDDDLPLAVAAVYREFFGE
jgi:aspartate kinase